MVFTEEFCYALIFFSFLLVDTVSSLDLKLLILWP